MGGDIAREKCGTRGEGVSRSAVSVGTRRASTSRVWVALAVVYVAWGSTYVGIRIMDKTIPPLIGAGIRYLLAGAGMYVFLWARRGAPPRVRWRELASVGLVSILLLVLGNGFLSYAEREVPAGLAALVVASVPLWLLAIRILTRDRPRRATLGGLGIGFLGVGLLVLRGGEQQGVSMPELLIVLGASLAWGASSTLSAPAARCSAPRWRSSPPRDSPAPACRTSPSGFAMTPGTLATTLQPSLIGLGTSGSDGILSHTFADAAAVPTKPEPAHSPTASATARASKQAATAHRESHARQPASSKSSLSHSAKRSAPGSDRRRC